ncbi:4'-phosphopantetheinyl transferase [Polyplosphaeria fusca]|uniref:holo-[acyl-carrier-protein] synthase n=1 Tax=Polyplosphaeria fusca TaxID=682080 RepID=A0A9P4QYD7_9PLEO|nr:4'-phosphopantetheinyl transferase [Polyplosphaeria fusca]
MTVNEKEVALTCWLLDTRALWPGDKISQSAAEALQLVSDAERQNITRKFHLLDAKMTLGSALIKRLFISKALGIPWKDVKFGRKGDPKHGKPCALLPDGRPAPIEFNVSHQAGLVALVGAHTVDVELGVDIVCVNERNDYRLVDQEGFDGWVDVYQEIFSPEESWDMKYNVDPFKLLDGTEVTSEHLGRFDRCCVRDRELVATLRRFYTYWCFKEAYIKLDGEALLAKWIQDLEFRGVRAPRAGTVARCSTHGTWGERVGDTEVWFKQHHLDDVRMEIQAFEENFMISVAAKPRGVLPENLTTFEKVDLETDLMDYARSAL